MSLKSGSLVLGNILLLGNTPGKDGWIISGFNVKSIFLPVLQSRVSSDCSTKIGSQPSAITLQPTGARYTPELIPYLKNIESSLEVVDIECALIDNFVLDKWFF